MRISDLSSDVCSSDLVTLDTRVEARDVYGYYCIAGTGVDPSSPYACNHYQGPQCRVVQSWDIPCGYDYYSGYYWGCYGTLRVDLVSCSEPVPGAKIGRASGRERGWQ